MAEFKDLRMVDFHRIPKNIIDHILPLKSEDFYDIGNVNINHAKIQPNIV